MRKVVNNKIENPFYTILTTGFLILHSALQCMRFNRYILFLNNIITLLRIYNDGMSNNKLPRSRLANP